MGRPARATAAGRTTGNGDGSSREGGGKRVEKFFELASVSLVFTYGTWLANAAASPFSSCRCCSGAERPGFFLATSLPLHPHANRRTGLAPSPADRPKNSRRSGMTLLLLVPLSRRGRGVRGLLFPSPLVGEGLGVRGQKLAEAETHPAHRRGEPLTPGPSPTEGRGEEEGAWSGSPSPLCGRGGWGVRGFRPSIPSKMPCTSS